MSKVIECKGCIDCPFKYRDYDGYSLGHDTIIVCNLAEYLGLPLYLITSYDSWQEDTIDFTIQTPIWCPLKNTEEMIIKLKE